jgi:site-specific DNA recombinase
VPAGEIERFVVDQIKCVGRDPTVIKETLSQARIQAEVQIERLQAERAELHGRLRDAHAEFGRIAAHPSDPRLADAHDRIRDTERRLTQIDDELATLTGDLIDRDEVATALADFDALWDCLAPREQSRVIDLLIERVTFDGDGGNVSITFRPSGIKTLADDLAERKEEAA